MAIIKLGTLARPDYSTVEEAVAGRLDDLATIRWQHEVGGTALPDGTPLLTDRETQNKLTAAYVKAKESADFTIRWKIAPGIFTTLDAQTTIVIADACVAHVQACFEREDELTSEMRAASTIEDVQAVDLQVGWP
jgi:hypothetical protein